MPSTTAGPSRRRAAAGPSRRLTQLATLAVPVLLAACAGTLPAPGADRATGATAPDTEPSTGARMTAMDGEMPALDGDGVFAVPGEEPDHHRLRFQDGQVSRNDSCMIRLGNRLDNRVPPVYINGEPVGFC